jgi:hypothetical protein
MHRKFTVSQVKLTLSNESYSLRKYRILELLNNLPSKSSSALKRSIRSDLKISRQTYANWLNASIYDKQEIPATALLKIAITLNVSPLELYNIPITPINTSKLTDKKTKTVLSKTGLSL